MFGIDDALIGAGATLLSGLFGGGGKEETTSTVDYVKMVKYAEAAGFNPLTALRNGGAAGFTTTSTGGAPLSARIADGVASGVDYYLKNFDPMKDDKRELEYKLVEAQLANLQADTAVKRRVGFGDVPTYTAGQNQRVMGAGVEHGRPARPVADAIGGPATPSAGKVSVTNPWTDGRVSPLVYDAQNFEDRYGDSEVAQMLYGLHVADADLRVNSPRYQKWAEKIGPVLSREWANGLDTVEGLAQRASKAGDILSKPPSWADVWDHMAYPMKKDTGKRARLPYRPPLSKYRR